MKYKKMLSEVEEERAWVVNLDLLRGVKFEIRKGEGV